MGVKFDSENQPTKRRGKAFRTLLLDSIRKDSLIGLEPSASKEKAEEAFLSHISRRAFDQDDSASGTLLKELLNKSYASIKATMPTVDFEFPENGKPKDQASAVMKAIADGVIPPDVGQIFIYSIKSMLDIEEITDLKARIDQLEELIGAKP